MTQERKATTPSETYHALLAQVCEVLEVDPATARTIMLDEHGWYVLDDAGAVAASTVTLPAPATVITTPFPSGEFTPDPTPATLANGETPDPDNGINVPDGSGHAGPFPGDGYRPDDYPDVTGP